MLLANPGGAESIDTLGLVFVLIAGACWAAYILIAQRAGRLFPGSEAWRWRWSSPTFVPLVPGIADAGRRPAQAAVARAGLRGRRCSARRSPTHWKPKRSGASRRNVFGVLMSMEPAVAALAGFVVLGQDLGAREIVAIALVVAASAGASIATPPEA